MRRRDGRDRPNAQPKPINAGVAAALSLLSMPKIKNTALQAMLSNISAAYTARQVPSVAIRSARPTTLAITSTCTGWTAKIKPAESAAVALAHRRANAVTATAAPACHNRFTAWNQAAEWSCQSRAYEAIGRG